MSYFYLFKIIVTTILVVVIAEVAKRNTIAGAILASVPIVSVLAMIWIYTDTKDTVKISQLSYDVFWLVIPSLILFITLPFLLKMGFHFYLALTTSIGLTVIGYLAAVYAIKYWR